MTALVDGDDDGGGDLCSTPALMVLNVLIGVFKPSSGHHQ